MKTSPTVPLTSPSIVQQTLPDLAKYNIEYFHIYTDEKIDTRHLEGLESLRFLQQSWSFEYDKIVLIDDYNPTEHITTAKEVLTFLKSQGISPDYWAYEGDLVKNAKKLLATLPEGRLKRSYARYIKAHGKYPCSLLTATWYLTRLGHFDHKMIKRASRNIPVYRPAKRLFNLLPQDYALVEARATQLILASPYAAEADKVQNLFYPAEAGRALELF